MVTLAVDCDSPGDGSLFYERCVHAVPLEQIKVMISNYQPDPAALVVPPWGRDALPDAGGAGSGSPPAPSTPSPRPRASKADQRPRRNTMKPLRFNTIKILNSLSYNPAMREPLKEAGAPEALHARLAELMSDNAFDEQNLHTGNNGSFAMTCTNEYLWTLRASIKLVGQDEVSLISDELDVRGSRWILAALAASLDDKGFPWESSTPATPAKYAQDIACLAVSDTNAKKLVGLGAFALIRRTLMADWGPQTTINMEQDPVLHAQALCHAAAAMSRLSFGEEAGATRAQIEGDEELMNVLRMLRDENGAGVITPRAGESSAFEETRGSADFVHCINQARKHAEMLLLNLKRHSDDALETVVEKAEQEDSDDGESTGHIMLSYCWGQTDGSGKFPNQQLVLKIREGLHKRGFNTCAIYAPHLCRVLLIPSDGHRAGVAGMDVDDLQGSTLNAMADAVEKADVVCIVMTRVSAAASARVWLASLPRSISKVGVSAGVQGVVRVPHGGGLLLPARQEDRAAQG